VLVVVSGISVAIGLTDTWLHAEASAVFYSSIEWAVGDALLSPSVAYGTGFNATACNNFQYGIYCGQDWGALWADSSSFIFQGYAAGGNLSTKHLITTLNDEDGMAIVTRPDVPSNITYTARSLGLTASCVSFGSACRMKATDGKIEHTNVNCSNIGYTKVPRGHNTISLSRFGVNVISGRPTNVSKIPQSSNLFGAQVELYYSSPNSFQSYPSPNDALVSVISNGQSTAFLLLANCTFAAYDISIQVTSGQTTLITKANASDETTARLWPGILYQTILDALIANTKGVAMTSESKDEVMGDLSQKIARLTLATVAGILAPIPPEMAGVVNSRLVSAYPFPALALFLALLFIYSTIVIALFVWCAFTSSPTLPVHVPGKKPQQVCLLQLVQMRLTNPLSFVASVFDQSSAALHLQQDFNIPTNSLLSLQTETKNLFDESTDTARLHVSFSTGKNETPRFEIRQRLIQQGSVERLRLLG